MATDRPLTFEIPIADFDLGLLPATARTIGSQAFEEAVLTYFMRQYAGKGINAGVAMDNRVIRVTLFPEHSRSLLDHAVALMREGKLDEGAEILAWMRENAEPGVGVLYNLGIAHSERGRFHAAIEALKACSAIDANYVDAWTGLGVAYQRLSQSSQAEQALRCAAPSSSTRAMDLRIAILVRCYWQASDQPTPWRIFGRPCTSFQTIPARCMASRRRCMRAAMPGTRRSAATCCEGSSSVFPTTPWRRWRVRTRRAWRTTCCARAPQACAWTW